VRERFTPRRLRVGLATRLEQIAGRFILSVNDVPKTREIFRRFAIESR
jgi:hypothetical protein